MTVESGTEATALVERLSEAFNTKDANAFAALFAPEAEFVSILGQRMRGREGIAAGHKVVFEKLLTGTRMTVTRIDVMPLSDQIVMMHAEWNRERLPEATATTLPPGSGVLTFIARRTAQDWELMAATNVQESTPPGAPRP